MVWIGFLVIRGCAVGEPMISMRDDPESECKSDIDGMIYCTCYDDLCNAYSEILDYNGGKKGTLREKIKMSFVFIIVIIAAYHIVYQPPPPAEGQRLWPVSVYWELCSLSHYFIVDLKLISPK